MTATEDDVPEVDTSGWNELLHSLRSAELRRTAPVDGVLLSVGCSGSWYFEWIDEMLRGEIVEHVGVEAYSLPPSELPDNVVWISESIGRGTTRADGTVDVVFAGQAIEHFWVDEVVSFLAESWRVLRADGRLILDSPNRRVTEAIGWWQPEHTIEFTTGEVLDLVRLAGFDVSRVRGIWNCYDVDSCKFLPLEPDFADEKWRDRVSDAVTRPDDAFCWWLECTKSTREPEVAELVRCVAEIAHFALPRARSRYMLQSGLVSYADDRFIVTSDSDLGCLRFGPYVPLGPGRYEAVFELSVGTEIAFDVPAAMCDVVCGHAADEVLVSTVLTGKFLTTAWRRFTLPFEITSQRFAVQFRVFAHQPGVRLNVSVMLNIAAESQDRLA